jgi:outer membrane protein assembly factor BamB
MKSIIRPTGIITVSLFLTASIACCQLEQEAYQWSHFRGHNSSGIASSDASPPLVFGPEKHVKWKVDLPEGTSSPVIWENRLYLTAYIQEKGALLILCLDRSNGEIHWCDSIFPEKIEKYHSISSPAQSSVAADREGIYIYSASFGVKSFNHEGDLRWEYPIPCPELKKWGHPVSPAVMGDKVIINLDYGREKFRKLLALDKFSGKIAWSTLTFDDPPLKHFNSPGFSTPVRFNNQVIVHKCGGLASFSLDDGSPLWWLPFVTNGISSPIVNDDHIYVTAFMELAEGYRGAYFDYDTFDKFLDDFDADKNKRITVEEIPEDMLIFDRPENDIDDAVTLTLSGFFANIDSDKNDTIINEEWTSTYNWAIKYVEDVGMLAIKPEKQGELTWEDVLWNELSKSPEVPGPVAINDCVYVVKNGGWLTCMDTKTGHIHYQERIGGTGASIASPVIGNGHLYLASYNGIVKVIKAGKEPVVVSETKLPGKIVATPAIAGNDLYIRTSERLYAFSEE